MTLTQLEIFSLVAELQGFTSAAHRLGISQSAVSHAIKALEQELGVELFRRHQNLVEPSEIGQQLLKEHGASRFLDGAAVLYVREGSGYDVTSEAIKRINARLPTVKLELPAPPKTAAPKS